MLKKHGLVTGAVIGLALLGYATSVYPGGSAFNAGSAGFNWKENYICNLFAGSAVNGAPNSARIWAISGWIVLCLSVAIFFVRFSTRIESAGPSRIIRYLGLLGMVAACLVVTPLHDLAITLALVFSMIAVLYILIFVLRSKLTYLKVLGVAAMVATYTAAFMYYTRTWLEALPTLQKLSLACIVLWFVCLHYFTSKADFRQPAGA